MRGLLQNLTSLAKLYFVVIISVFGIMNLNREINYARNIEKECNGTEQSS